MSLRINQKRIRERQTARQQRGKADARMICQALDGDWYGDYGKAFCPAHPNTDTPALSVRNAPDGRLLVKCFAGCSGSEVLIALSKRGLLDGSTNRRSAPRLSKRCKTEQDAERRERIEHARRCWGEAGPINGTLGEQYLRVRAITCELPQSLRFHSSCWHGPTKGQVPAMVAAVTIGGELIGVQRTFLAEPGVKAFEKSSKMMLGPCAGGAVHLSEGNGPLVVAEGIETALSLLSALPDPDLRVWAALSTSGMVGLVLPCQPGELVLAPDGDAPGMTAARQLSDRAKAAGWRVRIMQCPEDRDWNDMWREEAA